MDIHFLLLIIVGLMALAAIERSGRPGPVEAIVWPTDDDGQLVPSAADL